MIHSAVEGNLRVLTLDRPDRRNALTEADLEDLERGIDEASEPVVYLHGSGQAFCAGADLNVIESLDQDEARSFSKAGQAVVAAFEQYDGVVVAGIDGPARGGGVELALGCDLRVATPEATFAETGVTIGLFGAWGGTARLPDIVGPSDAMDLALSGRTIDAEEARSIGLVSRVVEDPRTVASTIASHDARTVRTIADLIGTDDSQARQEEREVDAFERLIASFDL